jgi:cob(I)alamin adenosyltransferase
MSYYAAPVAGFQGQPALRSATLPPMPRITRVYTRTGDDGTTALGSGERVGKDDPRIEAYGAVDELNSAIGVALALALEPQLARVLERVQNELFHLGSDLCVPEDRKQQMPVPRIEERHVVALEEAIDGLSGRLEPLANFLLPGGSAGAAQLQLARTISRRAERRLVSLAAVAEVSPSAQRYLNRLSDALFVMARFENYAKGVSEPLWDSRA